MRWRGCSRCAGGSSARRSPRAGAPVYVDYAHTPDALAAAIAALRPHVDGPADHGVRRGRRPRSSASAPEMGEVAAAHSDAGHRHRRQSARRGSGGDPRAGARGRAGRARDRRPARGDRAPRSPRRRPGDIVLIAGKGHEQGQIVGSGRGDARSAVRRRDRGPRMRRRAGRSTMHERSCSRPCAGRPSERDRAPPGAVDRRRDRRRDRRHRERRFPGCRASRSIRATCARATCSSRSRARRSDGHRFLDKAFANGAAAARGRAADRAAARPGRRHLEARLSCSRKAAREPRRGADRRGDRLGRQDRGQGSDLRRARPRQPGRGAPLGAQLQQPCRRAAEPGADARAQPIRRVRDGHEPCRRNRCADARRSARTSRSITTIAPAHIENLGSEEAIADAKAEIFAGLEPGGTAVIPADSPHFARLRAAAEAQARACVAFGRAAHAQVRLLDAIPAANGGSLVTADARRPAAVLLGRRAGRALGRQFARGDGGGPRGRRRSRRGRAGAGRDGRAQGPRRAPPRSRCRAATRC